MKIRKTAAATAGLAALASGLALAQYPILDTLAGKTIAKYQSATCEQLWEARGKPKSPEEQKAIELLRSDPQRRTYFLNKIAGPVANKMFECGMIP
jgi:hypothetical protein